jgi:hypothetical protein
MHKYVQCIATATKVQPNIEWWSKYLSARSCVRILTQTVNQIIEETPVQRKFHFLSLQVADLRADAENIITLAARTPANIQGVLGLLRRSEALEKEYVAWHGSWPAEWWVKTVAYVENIEKGFADSIVYLVG